MTQEPEILAAVDVGTTKVCTIVARREGNRQFRILSHSVVPSKGVGRGNIVDIAIAGDAIQESIRQASQQASERVVSAYVGITGSHVTFARQMDVIDWAASRGVITREDLDKVPGTVAATGKRQGHTVIHALPRSYVLDRQAGIRYPLGMHTKYLEVESNIISARTPLTRNLVSAIERAGLRVDALVLEPIASAEAVLTEDEKYEGTVLVDIGGGTSDIVIYKRGVVEHVAVIPIGGFQFTNDISVTFNVTMDAAESAKLEYGNTEPITYSAIDSVSLPQQGRGGMRRIALRDISQLVRERATEVVRMIRLKIQESGIEDTSACSIVLTGGSSKLPGLDSVVIRNLTDRIRIGGSRPGPNVPNELCGPEFATGVGLLRWAMKYQGTPTKKSEEQQEPEPESAAGPENRGARGGLFRRLFSN